MPPAAPLPSATWKLPRELVRPPATVVYRYVFSLAPSVSFSLFLLYSMQVMGVSAGRESAPSSYAVARLKTRAATRPTATRTKGNERTGALRSDSAGCRGFGLTKIPRISASPVYLASFRFSISFLQTKFQIKVTKKSTFRVESKIDSRKSGEVTSRPRPTAVARTVRIDYACVCVCVIYREPEVLLLSYQRLFINVNREHDSVKVSPL